MDGMVRNALIGHLSNNFKRLRVRVVELNPSPHKPGKLRIIA